MLRMLIRRRILITLVWEKRTSRPIIIPSINHFMIERIAVILAMMPIRFYWILKLARII
jgi:hypothetical protein